MNSSSRKLLDQVRDVIHIDGFFNLNVCVDRSLVHKLNKQGAVKAEVINRANIGLTADDLVRQWNEHHPDDPFE